MGFVLAFSLQDQVEKYGAYVGIAAFLGLAVLSLLYFAQARELKRLRDWAGRAPERAQEIEARAIAQAEEARRAPVPAPARSGAVGPARPIGEPAPATPAVSGNGRQVGVPVPMGPRPAVAAAAVAAGGVQMGPRPATAAPAALDGDRPKAVPDEVAPAGDETGVVSAGDEGGAAGVVAAGGEAGPSEVVSAGNEAGVVPAGDEAARDEAGVVPAGDEAARDEAARAGEAQPGEVVRAGDDRGAAGVVPAGDEVAPPPAPVPNGSPPDQGIPPAPIPRATPRPQTPRPVPAAPLRSPTRSTTLPPRRGTTAVGRRPAAVDRGGTSPARVAAVVVLGVLMLGGAAFAVTRILNDEEPAPAPNQTTDPTGQEARDAGAGAIAARPETVVVVLNGTLVDGLASRTRDELVAEGYSEEDGMIRTGDNTDQQRQDSVVLFASGRQRQARDVGAILDIDAVERIDQDTQALADLTDETGRNLATDVAVLIGADQAP